MSLLALLAARAVTGPAPDPGPKAPTTVPASMLHSTSQAIIDWGQSSLLVSVSQLPGYSTLREQDDIIYDPAHPDPGKRWCFYFSAMFGSASHVYVMHSPDGTEWTNPVYCFGGQDPSITQTWEPNPVAYRDEQDRLVIFYENNATDQVDAAVSTDGVTWTVVKAGTIPRETGTSGWDHSLTGSPNARHDGTRFIVGYEGIQTSPTHIETFSLAWGATPSTLVKSPHTPIIDPTTMTGLGTSIVSDAIYLSPSGDRAFLAAHDGRVGGAAVGTMWRMTTTKTDPTTWQAGDFTLIGGMVDPAVKNDLTLDAYHARLVTQPADDLTIVTAPLVTP